MQTSPVSRSSSQLASIFGLVVLLLTESALAQCVRGDCQDGYGTYKYSNSTLTSTFRQGKAVGVGKIEWDSGRIYEGEFIKGAPSTSGTIKLNATLTYSGEFDSDGISQGRGTYKFADGTIISGVWTDYLTGQAIASYPSGVKYEGSLKSGLMTGRGIYTYSSGTKYEGEFLGNFFEGQGIYTFTSGSRFVGEFKKDQFDGIGVMTHDDGTQTKGEWKEGRLLTQAEQAARRREEQLARQQKIETERVRTVEAQRQRELRAEEDRREEHYRRELELQRQNARRACLAQRDTCSSQCYGLSGEKESDNWYSTSPRFKCEMRCSLMYCD